jgi:hypothetical protein
MTSARSCRAFLLIGLLVAACIPTTVAPPPSSSPASTASASSQVEEPTASPEPSVEAPSEEPSASVAPAETASPPAETTPPEASAPASSEPGTAAPCSGSDSNRTFLEDAAAAVRWTVYCAVLPAGWFVDTGRYRGSGGGWVEIAYKGPGGARLELQEGAFCPATDGCVPSGSDAGDASFGDKTGTFVTLDDGGWAVVVDRGDPISWLAVGTGMDQATFRRLAGALAIVGG